MSTSNHETMYSVLRFSNPSSLKIVHHEPYSKHCTSTTKNHAHSYFSLFLTQYFLSSGQRWPSQFITMYKYPADALTKHFCSKIPCTPHAFLLNGVSLTWNGLRNSRQWLQTNFIHVNCLLSSKISCKLYA